MTALGKRAGTGSNGRAADRSGERRGSATPLATEESRATASATPDLTPAPDGGSSPRPTAAAVSSELDVDGLRRESARTLPARYRRGIVLIANGAYDEAIQVLREFVRSQHTSPLVIGALYWIGEAYMQLGQSYQAILAFTDVQQRDPRGEYAPGAGLARGVAFLQLGNASEARRAFAKVIAEHPDTPEALRASTHLRALGDPTP